MQSPLQERDGQWARDEGTPYPLGTTWIASQRAFNFALYSKHATSVRLLLYTRRDCARPRVALDLDPYRHKSGRVWHCRVPLATMRDCDYYAYVVDGPDPEGPFEQHAFHPDKILFDPYAKCLVFPSDFDRAAAVGAGGNAGRAPLGHIEACDQAFDWGEDPRPRHESDAVIYELHVRGFTQHSSSGVSAAARGTFGGVVERIPYLRELGVNVIELMPVFQPDPQGDDVWGYMPMTFFAPHIGYASAPHRAVDEFRAMVKALHAADMEVVLDVVYNHTAEGDARGPVYSYKGLDNSTYYLMQPGAPMRYANYAGTGNSLNCTNRYVRKMILDSMRYWVHDMHVDGFRFDLASVFTRNPDGSLNVDEPPIFGDIASDPDFDGVRMIAEPWDAAGAYELGRSFPGVAWLQWNDRFRDDVRRFARGDAGTIGSIMTRLYGSDDLFPDDPLNAYHAYQSVNYVTCHDGFTLRDLVSYNRKRNQDNGHDNRDGPEENYSWNCGWEGDDGAPAAVRALRVRQAKFLVAILLLSNGTPMLRAGDEVFNSQGGNNNPYNQDNETSWIDWRGIDEFPDVFRFVQRMIAFRKAHPTLGRSRFWREDVRWYGADGRPDLRAASRAIAVFLRGASQGDDDLYIMLNAGVAPAAFSVFEAGVAPWRRVVDTARPTPHDIVDEHDAPPVPAARYQVASRSAVVLVRPRG